MLTTKLSSVKRLFNDEETRHITPRTSERALYVRLGLQHDLEVKLYSPSL